MSKKEVNKISNEDIVEKVSDEVDNFLNNFALSLFHCLF